MKNQTRTKGCYNIVLVDEMPLVTIALKNFLHHNDRLRVVGTFTNPQKALKLAETLLPDLLITDLVFSEFNGFEFIKKIKSQFPAIRIVILCSLLSGHMIRRVYGLGVDRLLAKKDCCENIVEVVQAVLAGRPPTIKPINGSIGELPTMFTGSRVASLSKREKQVLTLITESLNNKQISARLFISEHTVKTHRRNLKRKLQAKTTSDLIRVALNL